jgi:hypothetical protein
MVCKTRRVCGLQNKTCLYSKDFSSAPRYVKISSGWLLTFFRELCLKSAIGNYQMFIVEAWIFFNKYWYVITVPATIVTGIRTIFFGSGSDFSKRPDTDPGLYNLLLQTFSNEKLFCTKIALKLIFHLKVNIIRYSVVFLRYW